MFVAGISQIKLQAHYMYFCIRRPNKRDFDTTMYIYRRKWRLKDSYAVCRHGLKKRLTHAAVVRPFMYPNDYRGNIQAGPSP